MHILRRVSTVLIGLILMATLVSTARADTGPTVSSVALLPLRWGDPLLQQQAQVVLSNFTWEVGKTGYEWAWADQPNASSPTSPAMRQYFSPKGQEGVRISYYYTKPNIQATLFVRGVDPNGIGPWYRYPSVVQTPKKPILVAIGDSITSGHHRDAGEKTTLCADDNYGYPRYVLERMNALLSDSWKAGYLNLAESGFSTDDVIRGGLDACFNNWPAPLKIAKSVLASHSPSWNQVVMTVGVDNTNWTDIVTNIIHDYAFAGFSNATSICSSRIDNWWGWNRKNQDKISRGVNDIVTTLNRADKTATIYQLGYYNPSGTGYDYANALGPLFPAECQPYVDKAIATLHTAILNGITKSGVPVQAYLDQANQELYMAGGLYQELQLDLIDRFVYNGTGPPPGWPHPNSTGAQRLAGMLAIW